MRWKKSINELDEGRPVPMCSPVTPTHGIHRMFSASCNMFIVRVDCSLQSHHKKGTRLMMKRWIIVTMLPLYGSLTSSQFVQRVMIYI